MISVEVVNCAGQQSSLRLQRIISIDGVPFENHAPPDLVKLETRISLLEGYILLLLQPQKEPSSAELQSPSEEQSLSPESTPADLLTVLSQDSPA